MPSRIYSYELFADYFQIYLQDESSAGDLSDSWTPQAIEDLLALNDGVIGVGTVRNVDVPVEVEIADAEPADSFDSWDHVVECGIDVPSGRIVIAGCTDYFPEASRIEVEPGYYRARVFYGQLDTLSDDGLDGDDRYRIVLWRGDPIAHRVLKRHPVPQ